MNKLRNTVVSMICALAIAVIVVFFSTGNVLSEDVTVIRFGHDAAETNERHTAVLHFQELVEEKSNGQMEVIIFPSDQLGSEAEKVESVTLNDLQMVTASAFSQYDQRIGVFELPYLFDSYEQAWEVLDGDIGREVTEPFLKDNLRILTFFENGFRHITANKAIENLDDLRGLKIRTPEFPISLSTFSALGANPTPMAFGELYMGLQQRTVDAQENPVANTLASRFNEVQDYLIMSGHQYIPMPVAISEEFWQSLTPEEQKIIEESALETAEFHRNLIVNKEEQIIDELEQSGMTVIYPDTDVFKENVEPVYEKFRKQFGQEFVDKVIEAAE
ncbi:TRAP transporter substrate-binding protein [Oceanobacillus sp. CFH 90083]|uniref:TRAP transporter substrate-binding protein n=1 Tax=Oceanobacillus sp. CFH 90083 TaxID=2592336 RepID=UPI00128D6B9F|nr:TRAP transporter substrate-binding protein [Oceanobacillus sp. CFH 90083]